MADTGITWGDSAPSSDNGITWGGDNQKGPQTDYSPSGFASQYSDAIQNAASKLNVPASAIAGQWGLETGWGKSVIPGTNNLGNIKDTSGKGPTATDNQTGSKDSYQQFSDPLAFSNAYVNLIQKNYPDAVGAKDPTAYATALKQGGYAQDSKYVSKVSSAANMANTALAALTGSTNANAAETPQAQSSGDFNTWLQQQTKGGSAAAPTADTANAAPSFDDWLKQAKQPAPATSTLGAIWDGAKALPGEVYDGTKAAIQHPIDAAKGVAASLWNPVVNLGASVINTDPSTADPMNGFGGDYDAATKAAASKAAQNANITVGSANPTAFNAGKTVGQIGAATAVGALAPEIPALQGAGWLAKAARAGAFLGNQGIQGGVQGGVTSAMNGDSAEDIAKNTLVGTAGGAVLGPVLHAAGAVAKPVVSKMIGTKAALEAADGAAAKAGENTGAAFNQSDLNMANKVAGAVDADATPQTAADVAAQMRGNADSSVPGYQRTAAETTDNPTVQAIQQGLDKSGDNSGLAGRANTNATANTDYLRQGATSDADLQAMKDAFANQQDTLATRGNAELGAVTPQQDSSVFDTPAMQRTLGRANTAAQNDGHSAIQHAFDAPNDDLVAGWNGIAGTADKTAALEKNRALTTSPMYEGVLGNAAPLPVRGELQDLLERPVMQKALGEVQTYKLNAGNKTPVINNGSITPQDLNIAKMHLDDYIQRMSNPMDAASADKWQQGAYLDVRKQLNNLLESKVKGFADVNKEFARQSDQIAESKFLTDQGMVNAFGKLNVSKLDSLVKTIKAGKANSNPVDPAKSVSASKLAQLEQLRDDAVAAANRKSAQGLHGNSYNYLRQAAEKDPIAAQQLQQHLEANSPTYQQFYQNAASGQQAIDHQANFNDIAKKFDTRTDGNVAWHDVKNLNTQGNDFSAANAERLNHVRDNLQRYATRTEKVAGSDTASNFGKREGFENLVAGERGSSIGNLIAGELGQSAFQTALGAKLFAHLPVHHIPLIGPLATQGTKALGSALAKGTGVLLGGDTADTLAAKALANRDAVESLLLNPKRLADAMDASAKVSKDKQKINENLISKVKGVQKAGGLLGAILAGQVANNSGNGRDHH
ncbi:glucosaminidase domain-containing protein [Paraburkholderia graminis]